jgi:hypothetical protein
MTITCKHCEAEKHPCLFRPIDVKRASTDKDGVRWSVCRECRKVRSANVEPNYWRDSNGRFYGDAITAGRAR